MGKGAYQHKQNQKRDGERTHDAGNPRRVGRFAGFDVNIREFFEKRGLERPSVSKILQTRGVEIGVKKWVRKKQ